MKKTINIHKVELMPRIEHLNNQLQRVYYPNRAFLFCNSQILEEWLELVGLMEAMDFGEDEKDVKNIEQDSRLFVLYQLTLYKFSWQYENLYFSYFAAMNELADSKLAQDEHESLCSSAKDMLSKHLCLQVSGDTDSMKQQFAELSSKMRRSYSDMQSALSDIRDSLLPIMERGMDIIQKQRPPREKVVRAIDDDLREYTFCIADRFIDDMKRDLDKHYKTKLSDPYTFDLWCEMLNAYNEALQMAMERRFGDCYDEKQELWDEEVRRKMDENYELIRRIWWLCYSDKFIDLTYPGDQGDVITLLDAGNLDMVYEIMVRRTLIQCEMFPELKEQHDKWLRGTHQLNNTPEEAFNLRTGKPCFTSAQMGIFIKAVAALTEIQQPSNRTIGEVVEKIAGYAATSADQNVRRGLNSKDIEVVAKVLAEKMPKLAEKVKKL